MQTSSIGSYELTSPSKCKRVGGAGGIAVDIESKKHIAHGLTHKKTGEHRIRTSDLPLCRRML